ncbi:CLUMA_CG006094, isoform A [Clunio marinus]|uniref:CLUMA_CG006094, isoform A n=1 Tax=Clunio marinus TaxID=568069 RepID=A0A1J1HYY8_9DIPT|nr:CLUMA_CG006094, isoform A [Clunio marinus]
MLKLLGSLSMQNENKLKEMLVEYLKTLLILNICEAFRHSTSQRDHPKGMSQQFVALISQMNIFGIINFIDY